MKTIPALFYLFLISLTGYGQNADKYRVHYISEMNRKYEEIKALKDGLKPKEAQRAAYDKEIAAFDVDIKATDAEYAKVNQKYNTKLVEYNTKDIEQSSKESELNNLNTQLSNLEKKIGDNSTQSIATANEIIEKNKLCNIKINEVLDKTEISEKKSKEVISKNAELNLRLNAIENISKEIAAKTNEVVTKSNMSDSLLAPLRADLGKLSLRKDTLLSDEAKTRAEKDTLKAEEIKLRSSLQNTKDELAKLQGERDALNAKVKKLNADAEAMKKEADVVKGKISTLKSVVETVKSQKALLKEEVDIIKSQAAGLQDKSKKITADKNVVVEKRDALAKEIAQVASEATNLMFQGVEKAKNSEDLKAIGFFSQALALEPKNSDALFLRGYANFIVQQNKAAYTDINQSIQLNPDYVKPYLIRAELNVTDKDYLAASKDYQKIIDLDPKNKDAYYNKGNIEYYFLNDNVKSCENWTTAESLGHDFARIQLDSNCTPGRERTVYNILQITKDALDTSYAYNALNPVKVGRGVNQEELHVNQIAYLELLRGMNGEHVKYQRIGTCCQYKSEHGVNGVAMLDKFQVSYTTKHGSVISKTIFISPYDFSLPKLPKGFKTTHNVD